MGYSTLLLCSAFVLAAFALSNPWPVGSDKADAWARLTLEDQVWLGRADPTDKYIVARAPNRGEAAPTQAVEVSRPSIYDWWSSPSVPSTPVVEQDSGVSRDVPLKETQWGTCVDYNNKAGVCMNVADCAGVGSTTRFRCPGPNEIQCCTPNTTPKKTVEPRPSYSLVDSRRTYGLKVPVESQPTFNNPEVFTYPVRQPVIETRPLDDAPQIVEKPAEKKKSTFDSFLDSVNKVASAIAGDAPATTTYDQYGRRIETPQVQVPTYDRYGRRIVDAPRSVDGFPQSTPSIRYDSNGRRIIDDAPRVPTVYDRFGRPIVEAPVRPVETTYDRFGRPIVEAPVRPVETTYDRFGRPIQAAPVQADVYDRYGRPIAPAPRTPVFYDQNGRQISI